MNEDFEIIEWDGSTDSPASQWNECLNTIRAGTFDNALFVYDPLSGIVDIQSGTDACGATIGDRAWEDLNGNDLFPGLIPGVEYTAQCVAPAGYVVTSPVDQTPQNEGDNQGRAARAARPFL